MRARRRRAAAVALSLVLVVAAAPIASAAPAAPVAAAAPAGDPSWSEVRAAKRDVRRQAAVVARIERTLDGLEAEAARLGDAALRRAQAARAAADRLGVAKERVAGLERQATAAETRAARARRTAGAVASQMARAGDPGLSVWLAGRRAGSLLYRLGALAQVGDVSAALLDHARAVERQAAQLGREAAAQAAVRDRLADEATAAANLARAAQAAADARVRDAKDRRATLVAQLASLRSRSTSLTRSYAAAQAAKAAAARAGRGGGGASLSGVAPGPGSLSPADAQAYAASRLGAYGWGGGQSGCLVRLWTIESGWRWDALNASSGAYGIPQSLPADKLAAAGSDWTTSSRTQIEWGLGYIRARYGTPCGALEFETSHTPYWY